MWEIKGDNGSETGITVAGGNWCLYQNTDCDAV